MKIDILEKAFSGIDEKLLDSVLAERSIRMNKEEKRCLPNVFEFLSFQFTKRNVAAVLILLMCSLAVIIPISVRNASSNIDPIETELNKPQYIANFTSPELKALYETEPFDSLLPKLIPAGLSFKSSYLSAEDGIANPNNRHYLSVVFESEISNLEVKIREYDGKTPIADIKDPKTYSLDLYYGQMENEGTVSAELPDVFRIIRSSDVSKEIASARKHTFKDGMCKAQIDILCDGYAVSYGYTGKEINASLFYECITSSAFFTKEMSEVNQAVKKESPKYIPAYDTPSLETAYALTPYSELLPRYLLSNCAYKSSYMSKFDPIGNPDNSKFLSLTFSTGDELWNTMEIKISEYKGNEIFANTGDKKTYALSCFYGDKSELNTTDRAYHSDLFRVGDITFDIVNEMVYATSDELYKAEISVLCGEYIVSYTYTGPKITTEDFYSMLISSNWIAMEESNNAD